MKTHENQITDYPKGARIEAIREIPLSSPSQNYYADPLPRGTRGVVTAHTDDGRAWINFDSHGQDGFGHTFEQPEKYIRVVCTHRDDNCPANHDQMSSTSDDAPATPERGEWEYIETRYGAEARAGQFTIRLYWTGLPDIRDTRALIQQIVTEHNQHSTLITQREGLLEGLRLAVDWMQGRRGGPSEGLLAAQVIKQLESVITTSEQEGRTER